MLQPRPKDAKSGKAGAGERFESRVTVVRKGEVRLPVELRVEFADGRVATRAVGRPRPLVRASATRAPKVVRAVVDPGHKIAIDVDPANNAWLDDERPARRAATKWAARYLFWLQNLLELHAVVG